MWHKRFSGKFGKIRAKYPLHPRKIGYSYTYGCFGVSVMAFFDKFLRLYENTFMSLWFAHFTPSLNFVVLMFLRHLVNVQYVEYIFSEVLIYVIQTSFNETGVTL